MKLPMSPRLGTTASFPNITETQGTTPPAFVPQGIGTGLVIGLGGIGLTVASRFLPGAGEIAAVIGGVGMMGLGLYKMYEAISGTAEPNVEHFQMAPGQQAADINFISGKILEPSEGGQAELSSKWSALFAEKRTFKIKFILSNDSDKALSALVELRSEQTGRAIVGDPDTATFKTNYTVELQPHSSQVINGFQPVKVLESVFEAQSYRSQDVVLTLLVRTSASSPAKQLDKISFTAW